MALEKPDKTQGIFSPALWPPCGDELAALCDIFVNTLSALPFLNTPLHARYHIVLSVIWTRCCACVIVLCPLTATDNCSCRLLYDKMMTMSMTSLSLLGIQATAPQPPQMPLIPLQPLSPATPPNQLCCVENCYPWIQLCRKVAGDLRNSTIDPGRQLLRLNTLPPQHSDELDKVRVGLFNG